MYIYIQRYMYTCVQLEPHGLLHSSFGNMQNDWINMCRYYHELRGIINVEATLHTNILGTIHSSLFGNMQNDWINMFQYYHELRGIIVVEATLHTNIVGTIHSSIRTFLNSEGLLYKQEILQYYQLAL